MPIDELDNLDDLFNEEALAEAEAKREQQLQQDEQETDYDEGECESCKI